MRRVGAREEAQADAVLNSIARLFTNLSFFQYITSVVSFLPRTKPDVTDELAFSPQDVMIVCTPRSLTRTKCMAHPMEA
jgi:hypothetical protein